MNLKSSISTLAATLLVSSAMLGSAWAQSSAGSLNLKLPPSDVLASASTAPIPASASTVSGSASAGVTGDGKSSTGKNGTATIGRTAGTTTPAVNSAPGVYYGDTSGHLGSDVADAPSCDDSKYNDAQVHGSVSTGVVSGSRIGTGSYTGGEVSVTKAFGDCDHPSGGISISIGGNTNNFNGGRGYRRGY